MTRTFNRDRTFNFSQTKVQIVRYVKQRFSENIQTRTFNRTVLIIETLEQCRHHQEPYDILESRPTSYSFSGLNLNPFGTKECLQSLRADFVLKLQDCIERELKSGEMLKIFVYICKNPPQVLVLYNNFIKKHYENTQNFQKTYRIIQNQ